MSETVVFGDNFLVNIPTLRFQHKAYHLKCDPSNYVLRYINEIRS
jgi:hypothetical protein